MSRLQTWMDKNALRDHHVAQKLGISRVQVSRIRRGITGASVKTAMRLQQLTGVKWWYFVAGSEPRKGRASR